MKKLSSLLIVLLVLAAIVLPGCKEIDSVLTHEETTTPSDQSSPAISSEILTVSVLDVGQADCIVIHQGDHAMIIDAGNNADSTFVVNQLKNMGIDRLDVVIGTHPHEDHIGGLDAVINSFEIGAIYMPKVSNNTKTFEDVLTAIRNKGLSVTTPVPGTAFTLGDEVQCLILAPNSASYDDLNNYSIVLKLTYNGKSFIFTGDAEIDSEEEILAKGYDLKADVLKVGHHGSTSSTSDEFLQSVSPEYAVICVGVGNTYGHPHQETLDKLDAAGVTIYRTDLSGGTIQFVVDGDQLLVSIEK